MKIKNKYKWMLTLLVGFLPISAGEPVSSQHSYTIVDTNQNTCYDNQGKVVQPGPGDLFFGQDANYQGNQPAYRDNGDGTVSDLNTGLMWQQDPGEKMTWNDAVKRVQSFSLAGYSDWRLPSIKELYSLIQFDGINGRTEQTSKPYIDTEFFTFKYGDPSQGERIIDSQMATSTLYTSTTMHGNKTMFGVNFADGRIKGYPVSKTPQGEKKYQVLYVRGNPDYGQNQFEKNDNGTVTDRATGLMWVAHDAGKAMSWQEALQYGEKSTEAGYSDWRLPNAKELQSIVDYSRSPAATGSPAIDPVLECSAIQDEGGHKNYPFYWTSTSHLDGMNPGSSAVYVAFGEALGFMKTPRDKEPTLMDVHGAGAQRSDPKLGNPKDFPYGHGPQGDVRRINNFVRLVRDVQSGE